MNDIDQLAHTDSLELLAMNYGEEPVVDSKPESIVTRESFMSMLIASRERQKKVVGRALVALYKRQTEDEKTSLQTKHDNSRGFSAPDAKSGTLCAKYFLRHGTLQDWQFANWMREEKGLPRIAKYVRQLNEIALAKAKA